MQFSLSLSLSFCFLCVSKETKKNLQKFKLIIIK